MLGYPAPLDAQTPTITSGVVTGLRSIDGVSYLQIDAAANPGNSGGPVLNADGELVGIVSARARDTQGLTFAVPLGVAQAYANAPVSRGTPAATPSPTTTPAPTPTPYFMAFLWASEEAPPITDAEANCSGFAVVRFTSTTAQFDVTIQGCPAGTAINIGHIHQGSAGVNGAVLINTGLLPGELVLSGGRAVFNSKTITVDPTIISAIIADPARYYVNFHSTRHGGGVIRGQLTRG